MARSIEPKTVEKYGRFLKTLKENEGKEINMEKTLAYYSIPKSVPSYMRRMKKLDYTGNKIAKIIKVDYALVYNEQKKVKEIQPIIARHLIQQLNDIKRQNDEKKRLDKAGLQTNPTEPQKAVQERTEKYSIKNLASEEMTNQAVMVRHEDRPKKYKVHFFGVHIATVTPEY
jgi:predicted ATP-binding protein involved in virulence